MGSSVDLTCGPRLFQQIPVWDPHKPTSKIRQYSGYGHQPTVSTNPGAS